MKNSIQPLDKSAGDGYISGTIDHTSAPTPSCKDANKDKENIVANLQTLFYEWEGDTSQYSLAYKTCFETLDENNSPVSRSLYVVVFPNGIHLSPQDYQQLLVIR